MYYFFKYIRPLFLQVNLRQDISKWRIFFFFYTQRCECHSAKSKDAAGFITYN